MTHQFRRCHIPTSVSLNCTNVHQGIMGILAVLEPRLVASFIYVLKPIFVFFCLQMLSAIWDLSYFNELLREFLALLDHNDAPIS